MDKLRVLSLFAGIGGFDLGLERTGGFETVAVAELDPYASKVLALRFPGAPNLGDVTKAEYPNADIICAGFPCQDISLAGLGAGLAGARSGLWREVVRAVRVVRPKFVLLENVAALLGRGLDTVLRDLAEVGYDAEWHCIPASAVGAPHRRDRIWIIAHPRSEQHEGSSAPFSGAIAEELSRAAADASPMFGQAVEWGEPDENHARLGALADTERQADGRRGIQRPGEDIGSLGEGPTAQPLGSGQDLADTNGAGLAERELFAGSEGGEGCAPEGQEPPLGGWWGAEPNVGRVAHGIPKRVDRLRCLGNAVVPQIPELIGRAILASLQQRAAA